MAPSAESIFEAARKLPPGDRINYVQTACGGDAALSRRVEKLLSANDVAGRFLEPPTAERDGGWGRDLCGARIGAYTLVRKIGEGGMGAVYLAEQTDPMRRTVAVKVIKPGMDSASVVARFEAERQALALMDHPNIAKVFDAGTTSEGRPFFVMELINGVPITHYCDQERLSPRERLDLFIQVCEAVQHAHQKGVIHRDLKPTNVLVGQYDGRPLPKVIDFGVAKAVVQRLTERTMFTEAGQIIGTLEYMAPEQAELNNLDIDTRVDIYALGVILYELLAGSPPFTGKQLRSAAFDEMLRMIREVEPPKPSTRLSRSDDLPAIAASRKLEPRRLARLVHGELDWIAMKCLEKERGRRYETANGLARDIQRYLNDEPVLAGPPGARYRLRKFARRNQRYLAAAAVVTAAMIIAVIALGASAVFFWREKHWAEEALLQTQEAQRVDREARDRVERGLYFQCIARAHLEWSNSDAGLADQVLDACPASLRQWEWHYLKRLCHGYLFTLRGHSEAVHRVAFSPDGLLLASGGLDKTVKIWDVAGGREIAAFRGHKERINRLAFSPDGRRLAVASGQWSSSQPGELTVWDLATRTVHCNLVGHKRAVMGAAFGPDGRTLVSCSIDDTIKVWDLASGQLTRTIRNARGGGLKAVAVSPDGKRIVTGGWGTDENLRLRDATDGRVLLTLAGHTADVLGVAFSADGKRVISASLDGTAGLWDAATGRRLLRLVGPGNTAQDVSISADGRTMASAHNDGSVKLWDTTGEREATTLRGHTRAVMGIAFSPGGNSLATAGADQTVKIWDVTTSPYDRLLLQGLGNVSGPAALAFSPDGQTLAAGGTHLRREGSPGRILTWHPATGQPTPLEVNQAGGFRCLAFSPDGRHVAADSGTAVTIRDAQTGREIRTFTGHAEQVTSVAFGPSGQNLVSGSNDGTVKVWDTANGQLLSNLPVHAGCVNDVAIDRDGGLVATAGADGIIRLWDVGNTRPAWTVTAHTGSANSLAFSPDGRQLATGGDDNAIRIWDVGGGKLDLTFTGHLGPVFDVAYAAPDGGRLASASTDGTVRIWDPLNGQEALTLRGPPRAFRSVAFSPNGRFLAAGSESERVVVWDSMESLAGGREKTARWHWIEAVGLEARKQWSAALVHRDRLLQLMPNDATSWNSRGWCHLHLEEWDAAIGDFSKFLEFKPGDARAWGCRAWCQEHRGRWSEARADYSKGIAVKPDYWEGLLGRGRCHLHFDNFQEALSDLTKTIRLRPDNDGAWHLRGNVHDRLGELDKAVVDYTQAVRLNPRNALAWHERGLVQRKRSRWDEVVADCSKAIEIKPEFAAAWHDRGFARMKQGRWGEAVADLSRSLEFAPKHAASLNDLAWLLATCPEERFRDAPRAVNLAQKAVQIRSTEGNYHTTLAATYYRAGDWNSALAAAQSAARLNNGGTANDLFLHAMIRWQLGKSDEARQDYDKAIRWLENNKADRDESHHLHAEAKALLRLQHGTS